MAQQRILPINKNLTTTERLLKDNNIIPIVYNKSNWEIGRLVLQKEYRGIKNLINCLYLTAQYLIDNTNIEYIFASCSYKMTKIYKKFGFVGIGKKYLK